MAATKYLARDLTLEISTAAGVDTIPGNSDDTWTPVGGLNSLTHSPSTARADTGDFNSNGREDHIVAQRGESWALAGFAIEDVADGTRDPGQLAIEALGRARGLGATGYFRITSPGGNTIIFRASAEVTLAGGGHNDAAAWSASLTVAGEPEYAAPI